MRSDPRVAEPLSALAVDNLLTDWERLAPGLLRPAVVEGNRIAVEQENGEI